MAWLACQGRVMHRLHLRMACKVLYDLQRIAHMPLHAKGQRLQPLQEDKSMEWGKRRSYKTLTGRKKAAKANPKITALQVELAHVDSEIEKLLDSLTGANNVLLSYVNVKIAELDGRKQELLAKMAELTVEAISPEQVSQISGYLDTWKNVSFDDKRRVVDLMITTIAATSDSLNITWKI